MLANNSSEAEEAALSQASIEHQLYVFDMQQAYKFLPVFIFLLVIMVVGTLGNTLVLFVYGKRFQKTSSNYFIVSMAVFDLLACFIGLPTEIYDLLHSFTFYSSAVCKAARYTEAVTVYGSAFILVEIAVDRYFKICRPLKLISLCKIRAMCIGAGVAAVLISLITIPLYGIARTPTPNLQISGHDCSIEERYRKGAFARGYYNLLGAIFMIVLLMLSVIYVRIWLEIKRRKKLVIGDTARCSPRENIAIGGYSSKPRGKLLSSSSTSSDESCTSSRSRSTSTSLRPRLESIAEAVNRFRVSRTTLVLFIVTVAFIVSFLPGLVIMVCRSAIKQLEEKQTSTEEVLSKLFSKFFFVNNAVNPIIYSLLNVNFRRRSVILMKKLFTCKKQKRVFHFREKTDSQKSNKSTKTERV